MSSEEAAFHMEFSIHEIYLEYRPKERVKRQKEVSVRVKRQKEVSVGRSSCVSLM